MTVKSRKQYSSEFKAQILELESLGRKPRELAQEFGISKDLIYAWKRKASQKASQLGSDSAGAEGDQEVANELRRLRKRVADLELDNDILKKAALILGTKPQARPEK